MDNPWTFWKWLIPVYNSVLCISTLLTVSYVITAFSSAEFLLYIDNGKIVFDLLPTLPTVFMIVEFPFNMIPFDWPMLIFVELLFSFYMLLNFIIVSIHLNHETVYEAFDWYGQIGHSLLSIFICYASLAAIFAIFWVISSKWKLPKYQRQVESRFGQMSSLGGSVVESPERGDNEIEVDRIDRNRISTGYSINSRKCASFTEVSEDDRELTEVAKPGDKNSLKGSMVSQGKISKKKMGMTASDSAVFNDAGRRMTYSSNNQYLIGTYEE